ncbi:hypothetical protein EXW31_00140 (plasmid) [Bacillus mycoides]|uniref:D52 family tumor protein n=1 Tax=Bacillus mycoides TaxID=1405 RepID=UPI001C01FA47|nr:D52 family tumor protein [Bacillus mycoides]QWG42898.1 hypothetical protein EXW31_00140 [Bacillus mycoides]
MPKPLRFRLSLKQEGKGMQHFSEDPNATPPAPEGGDPNVTPPATPPEPPVNPEVTPPVAFTQEQMDTAKKEQEAALLKKLGVEDLNQLKDTLKGWNEHQESLKTDQQKRDEKLTTYETQIKEKDESLFNLQAENAAIKSGIKEDSINDVITLAKTKVSDDVDIAKAIEMVVEKHPYFKGVAETETPGKPGKPKPTFTTGQHQQQTLTESDKWKAAFAQY